MNSTGRDSYRVQSAERALDVLEAVATSPGGLRAGEIAHLLDLPFSTAHRLAALLTRRGYLVMHPDTRRYSLGPALLRLRGSGPGDQDLEQVARPLVCSLAVELGETVYVGIYDGDAAVVLCGARPNARLSAACRPGSRLPLHASACGKALLAFGPSEWLRAVLGPPLPRLTERTIAEADCLEDELHATRGRGYACEVEECEAGLGAVAAPIGSGAELLGALTMAGPISRLDHASQQRAAAALQRAAMHLALRVPAAD
jgi:IclR family acetate operon transcriptional repressor